MKLINLLMLFFAFQVFAKAQNSPAPIRLVQFVITPNSADWNYRLNESATAKISVLKFGVPIKNVIVSYEVGPEMLPPDKKQTITLKEGTGEIAIGTKAVPGFRQLVVRTNINGRAYSDQVKVAFEPERIQPTITLPADFAEYWDSAKARAANIPMDADVTLLPEQSTTTVNVYLVNLQNDRVGRRIYGYLCKPKKPGKYPVVFSPPGAGIKPVTASTSLAEMGFITFNIEIHGISPLVDAETYRNITNAFGEYWLDQLDDKDNYYYKSVYLGCIRSIDFLCGLPEFDGKNVVVSGGSQGGALSIVTAALDKRVTCLVAFYPALSDITGYLHGRAGGWPHMLNQRAQAVNNTPAKLRTIAYYDVVNFARHISVPGFYSWGYNDNTVPPTSVFAAVNVVKAPKTIAITPISAHWRFEETNQESIDWIRKQLK
ncbi:acetylxylan esterase [Segetibacter sp. 3557_3]|nr:acetylxylan esterase [Segetibacter sp. 3557_3]